MFKYVWPQWPQIIVIVASALVIAAFLSLSFVTIIPLLKVMMGDEGIHGWVERKICHERYGIVFNVPDHFNESQTAHFLRITNIKEGSPAQKAGLQTFDIITDVNEPQTDIAGEKPTRSKLLEILATADSHKELTLQISQTTANGPVSSEVTLNSGNKPFYVDAVEKLINILPREQTEEDKTKVIVYIIIGIGIITIIRCIAKFFQEYMTQKVVQVSINHRSAVLW